MLQHRSMPSAAALFGLCCLATPADAGHCVRATAQVVDTASVDNYGATTVAAKLSGATGSAQSSTDLATGEMKVFATTSGGLLSDPLRLATAGAVSAFDDEIRFNISGADDTTRTVIQISAIFHSVRDADLAGSYTTNSSYSVNGIGVLGFNVSKAGGSFLEDVYIHRNGVTTRHNESAEYLSASSTFEVVGANPVIMLAGTTGAFVGRNATVNALNTARVRFDLPAGVTFTSSSGIFLSAANPLPEPATWAMLIGGFGLIGGAMRSARREPALELAA